MKKILLTVLVFIIFIVISFVIKFIFPIISPKTIFQEVVNNVNNIGSTNCGTIKVHAGIGTDSISDTENSTTQKLQCFLNSLKLCNKSYLKTEYITWESYQEITHFRTEKTDSGCRVKFDRISTDFGFFKKTEGHCSTLTVYNPRPKEAYGFLDKSNCKDE